MPVAPGPHEIETTRLILDPDGSATTKAVSDSFYAELDEEFDGFRKHLLFSRFSFERNWPTWEVHPHGDEFVYLLEGDTDFLLRLDGVEQRVRVSEPGSYVVVPRGAWHTAQPHKPTVMLFVTPGEGTENLPSPPEGA